MEKFKRLLPTIVMLLFELAVGILLLINGERFTQLVFIIFGVCLLVSGIVTLIRSLLAGRKGGSIPTGQLVVSVILLGVGAFFAAASGSVLSVMSAVTLVIGMMMAFSGILKLAEFITLRKIGDIGWLGVVSAVVTLVLGIVIAFNPFGATEAMWTILGIMIIVSAAFDIISLILFGSALKKMPVTVVEAQAKVID